MGGAWASSPGEHQPLNKTSTGSFPQASLEASALGETRGLGRGLSVGWLVKEMEQKYEEKGL